MGVFCPSPPLSPMYVCQCRPMRNVSSFCAVFVPCISACRMPYSMVRTFHQTQFVCEFVTSFRVYSNRVWVAVLKCCFEEAGNRNYFIWYLFLGARICLIYGKRGTMVDVPFEGQVWKGRETGHSEMLFILHRFLSRLLIFSLVLKNCLHFLFSLLQLYSSGIMTNHLLSSLE